MKKQPVYFLVLLAVAALSFNSCKNSADYKKTKGGLMYKIFSNSKDSAVKTGNVIKIDFTIKIGSTDSVLQTSVGKSPAFVPVQDVPSDAYSQVEVFNMLKKGDSAVIVQMVDTLVKKSGGQPLPPFLKKGDKLITLVKVLEVFKSQELASADREAEAEKEKVRQEKEKDADLVKSDAELVAWLAANKINAVKTGKGTYVVVKDPGTGMQADSGKYVTVRYEGTTLTNKVPFESTMDPKTKGYTLKLGAGEVIRGWDEGLKLFKKGGKGTLYVPGPLAYGRNPRPGSPFKPNETLVFDIIMEDVTDTAPAQPQQQELPPQLKEQMEKMQKQQQQQQQQKPAH